MTYRLCIMRTLRMADGKVSRDYTEQMFRWRWAAEAYSWMLRNTMAGDWWFWIDEVSDGNK